MIVVDPMRLRLSRNFRLNEFVYSVTAMKHGIMNLPDEDQLSALIALSNEVLQPVRDMFGPCVISSGLRVAELNSLPEIGGADGSQHVMGEAVDVRFTENDDLRIPFVWLSEEVNFDQLIWEFGKWVHVSYTTTRMPRGEVLTARKTETLGTVYTRVPRGDVWEVLRHERPAGV